MIHSFFVLVIFAGMKRPLKQLYLLFMAVSLTIIFADCVLVSQVSFHEQISANKECPALPGHFDDSHLNHAGDDVFCSVSRIQPNCFLNQAETYTAPTDHFKSNYLTSIWQPPKRS
jgi:hypothetical protein